MKHKQCDITTPLTNHCEYEDCDREADVQCQWDDKYFCARHIAEHLLKVHWVE